MKKYLAPLLLCLLSSTTIFAYTISSTLTDGSEIQITFDHEITEKTQSFQLCRKDSKLDVTKIRLWMKMPNGHEHGSSPLSWKRINQNCFQVTRVNFVMSGDWLIQFRYPSTGWISIPVFVAHQKTILKSNGSEVVRLLTPRSSTRHKTKWLLCGIRPIISVSLESSSQAEISQSYNESDVDENGCVVFSRLPIKSGKYSIVVTDNSTKEFGGKIHVQ